jgi:hypothetical protein
MITIPDNLFCVEVKEANVTFSEYDQINKTLASIIANELIKKSIVLKENNYTYNKTFIVNKKFLIIEPSDFLEILRTNFETGLELGQKINQDLNENFKSLIETKFTGKVENTDG